MNTSKRELIADILPLVDWLRAETGVNVLGNITIVPREQIDVLDVADLMCVRWQLQAAARLHLAVSESI